MVICDTFINPDSSCHVGNEVSSSWDPSSPSITEPSPQTLLLDNLSYLHCPVLQDGEFVFDNQDNDLFYDPLSVPTTNNASSKSSPREQFGSHMVNGNAVYAASVIVAQALFQTPLLAASPLPVSNVMLFLYLSKLVISTGHLQQGNLSKVLQILYPYAERSESSWAPLPCTVSGFMSRITNVTNQNSLVSILPIPNPETLSDGHGYTPFREILTHTLMMNSFEDQSSRDPKWQSLAMSDKFQSFMRRIPPLSGTDTLLVQQVAVGIIVWTDGWDTSTGTKSNRSPMHTGTVSLLFVDVMLGEVVGIATYPNMGGPGKADHGTVFHRFEQDLVDFEAEGSDRVFQSCHFEKDVEIHTQVLFIVQDQPERRQASGLLGGGSTLHALFGTSCDFKKLAVPFVSCTDCEQRVHAFIRERNWLEAPLAVGCTHCLGWNLKKLNGAVYQSLCKAPNHLGEDTPGAHLFKGPGKLASSLLLAGWNHCIQMYAVRHVWIESDVKKYLGQLCINDATVTMFIDACRRYVFLQDIRDHPEDYSHNEVADSIRDLHDNPKSYDLPDPPAMWSLSETEEKPEGIMHLSMGVQKAIIKFIIRWASENKQGTALQKRLSQGLTSVQELKISYCPCRPYKDDKFGGFNAESYRGMTMVSTQLYRCLNETGLAPPPRRGENPSPQQEWLREDNMNWMYLRDVDHSPKISAPEARQQVRALLADTIQLPIVNQPKESITTSEIRNLVASMYNMFRAIFCTDLFGVSAKNRATASVMRFLSLMEVLDRKLNPKRDKPIWIAKYNFLGLLRTCESFDHFRHARNLYEGGVIGEGVVKLLRPLTAAGTHRKWATNLLLKHYRQLTLDLLIDATEGVGRSRKHCPLGDAVESCKFKRYAFKADISHLISVGKPLPVLIYGSAFEWKAGVIIVVQKRWYFCEILFDGGNSILDDVYGLAYHHVVLAADDICLGSLEDELSPILGIHRLPFWDYGLVLPDILQEGMDITPGYRYAIVRSNWQYLDRVFEWNEFD